MRFIAAFNKCSTKRLSKLLTTRLLKITYHYVCNASSTEGTVDFNIIYNIMSESAFVKGW